MRVDGSYIRSFFNRVPVVSFFTQHKKIAALAALALALYCTMSCCFPKMECFLQDKALLTHAFSYLTPEEKVRCSQVCKQWYLFANDESLWQAPEEAFDREVWKLFDMGKIPPVPREASHDFYRISHATGYKCLLAPILETMDSKPISVVEYFSHHKGKLNLSMPFTSRHWTLLIFVPLATFLPDTQVALERLVKDLPGFECLKGSDEPFALYFDPVWDHPVHDPNKEDIRSFKLSLVVSSNINSLGWTIQRRYFFQPQTT